MISRIIIMPSDIELLDDVGIVAYSVLKFLGVCRIKKYLELKRLGNLKCKSKIKQKKRVRKCLK